MSSQQRRVFGWVLLLVNLGYCAVGLATGAMEGLGEVFGWFTQSPHMPTTFERKPVAFLLGLAAHAAIALYGWSLVSNPD